jgi:hypothetical protein
MYSHYVPPVSAAVPPSTSSSASTHVLVFVSSKTCSACKQFMPHWEPFKRAFLQKWGNRVDIETISLNSLSSSELDTTQYPRDLARYIGWYPTFILIPKQAYHNAKGRGWGAIANGSVFNGRFPVGTTSSDGNARVEPVPASERQTVMPAALIQWIERQLAAYDRRASGR